MQSMPILEAWNDKKDNRNRPLAFYVKFERLIQGIL